MAKRNMANEMPGDIYMDLGNEYPLEDKEIARRNNVLYMLNRTQSMFDYEGLPETIDKKHLEMFLQCYGFAGFYYYKGGKESEGLDRKEGLYIYGGGLGGRRNEYYEPTLLTIANPFQSLNVQAIIGKDCEIVWNDSMHIGLLPMLQKYATLQVENDLTSKLCTIQARLIALLSASDDRTRASAEKYLHDIIAGKLGVIADSAFLEGIKVQPFAQSGTSQQTSNIEYSQYLKASQYNDIGLNANYNMKREAVNAAESQMNFDALLPLVDNMLVERQEGLDRVNAMFGTNISVKLASSWEDLQETMEESPEEEVQDEPDQEEKEVKEDDGEKTE